MSIKDEIREKLQGMTKEELIAHFKKAGFNVVNGTGKISIIDNEKS